MTEKRYFYTCPLMAAYMAKYFGMDIRLDDPREGPVFLETTLLHGLREWRDAISACADYKFYIHPDSLHLLEPQAGDLITWEYPAGDFKERHSYQVITDGHNHNHFPANAKRLIEETGAEIIQRNGVAFMWPKSEAAC